MRIEPLEERTPLAVYTVNVTADQNDGVANGVSLRDAIALANANAGPDTIQFNIPGAGPHVLQFNPLLPSLSITGQVTIDGYTQPGASMNTFTEGSNAVIKVLLDGSPAGSL